MTNLSRTSFEKLTSWTPRKSKNWIRKGKQGKCLDCLHQIGPKGNFCSRCGWQVRKLRHPVARKLWVEVMGKEFHDIPWGEKGLCLHCRKQMGPEDIFCSRCGEQTRRLPWDIMHVCITDDATRNQMYRR